MKTALFVGHARAPANTVTGSLYKVICVVLEIDSVTGEIVAADVMVASPVARDYLVRMLVGRNLMGELGLIVKDIERNYHSATQKAIVQALNDLGKQYMSTYLKVLSTQFGYLDI